MRQILFSVIFLMMFLVTACGGTATPDAMIQKPVDTATAQVTPTADAMMPKEEAAGGMMMPNETPTSAAVMSDATAIPEAMVELPAWFGIALTDVRTGTSFTIQELKGNVILVEPMAVWCSKCLAQQREVRALRETLGQRADFVTVSLDIDPFEDTSILKDFADTQGFNWLYAVSPADVSRDLASLYGNQFLNPPSTPMLVIDRQGVVHTLPFGIKSADELLQFVQPFLDESM